MNHYSKVVSFFLVLSLIGLTQAQWALNSKADPIYSSVNLSTGFDLYSHKLFTGGPIPINEAVTFTDDACASLGFTSERPTLRVNLSGNTSRLNIFTLSPADTSLVISDPKGNWYCNNDFEFKELDAFISFQNPLVGTYDIWVGQPFLGEPQAAELVVAESDVSPADFALPPFPVAEPLTGLVSEYGYSSRQSSSEDVFVQTIDAGGDIPVGDFYTDTSTNLPCAGYTESAPDYSVNWVDSETAFLRFFFIANSDTSLLISDPQGNWFCNDNYSYFNPAIDFFGPTLGRYDIWVGNSVASSFSSGELYISKLQVDPADYVVTPPLDANLAPNFGSASLNKGFKPDPYTVDITAGGDLNSSLLELGEGCTGTVTQAPDFRLEWSGSSNLLRLLVASSSDITLLVLTPDDRWICNDDISEGNTNAGISFSTPQEGLYDIWIGSLSGDLANPGTLFITENQANPEGF